MDGEGLIFKGDRLLVETSIALTRQTVCEIIIIIAELDVEYDTVVGHTMKILGCSLQDLTASDNSRTCAISIVVLLRARESTSLIVNIDLHIESPEFTIIIQPHLVAAVICSVVGHDCNRTQFIGILVENASALINDIDLYIPTTSHLLDIGSTRLLTRLSGATGKAERKGDGHECK